tara:strand:+ start:2456 stop:2662 length:207 start_codon:yes stop_codon:yes gene_type:complete
MYDYLSFGRKYIKVIKVGHPKLSGISRGTILNLLLTKHKEELVYDGYALWINDPDKVKLIGERYNSYE